jgi:3-hydroxyisobutyryl-CoA hydrolase
MYYSSHVGLTGLRIGAKALLECGFADYYLPQTATGVFRENMVTASTVKNVTDAASLGRVLAGLGCSTSAPDSLPGSLVGVQGVSEACFSQDSVSGIMAALQRATQDMNIPEAAQQWAGKALKKLREVSPTSLRVTLQQLDLNKTCSVEDAFRNDFRLCVRLIEEQEGDFKEGVRALLIDKDKNPRWQNADMTEEELAVYVQRFTYTTESAFYVKDLEVQSKQDTPCE